MPQVTLEINGKSVEAPQGATILQAAKAAGIEIPTLCDDERLEPYGACRMCMVEIEKRGRTRLVASCLYPVEEGLAVQTEYREGEQASARCSSSCFGPPARNMPREYGVTRSRFDTGNGRLQSLRALRPLLRRGQEDERALFQGKGHRPQARAGGGLARCLQPAAESASRSAPADGWSRPAHSCAMP